MISDVQEVKEDRIHKKRRWNLFNTAHKTSTDKYRENYDKIKWGRDDETKDTFPRYGDHGHESRTQ